MTRAHSTETARRNASSLKNALGSGIGRALDHEDVTEILVNADGRVWLDTLSRGMTSTDEVLEPTKTGQIVSIIAGLLGQVVDARHPILEGDLPFDGSRVEGVLPPVSVAPVLAIRKRASRIYALDDYLLSPAAELPGRSASDERPTHSFTAVLDWALQMRKNILVVGGTSSAKTSLLNSLFERVLELGPKSERFFLIEDTFELQCPAENRVNLQTSESVSLAQLVRVALRMRPDRIIIGETRGAEALPMLRAWNTGHEGGMTTVHANSALEGLYRLEELCQEANVPPNPRLIARTIDLVVFLRRVGTSSRVITEMLHVLDHDGADYAVSEVRNFAAAGAKTP